MEEFMTQSVPAQRVPTQEELDFAVIEHAITSQVVLTVPQLKAMGKIEDEFEQVTFVLNSFGITPDIQDRLDAITCGEIAGILAQKKTSLGIRVASLVEKFKPQV